MLESSLQKLSENKVRVTETRRTLLTIFHQTDRPLAPPEIVALCHAAGRPANKTTIYRDLVIMERVGILRRVILSDRKQHFELIERGHHHHFVCKSCDRVEDMEIDEVSLVARATAAARRFSFRIDDHAIEFYGQCATCLPTNTQLQSV